jgi:hypothetical protein
MKCTYEGCDREATIPQVAKDGEVWANFCKEHEDQINKSIDTGDVRALMRDWVKGQGGAKAAADRVMGKRP